MLKTSSTSSGETKQDDTLLHFLCAKLIPSATTKEELISTDFRATSRRMARNGTLSPATVNPLGFYTAQARKSGTLLDFVCNEKEKHPDFRYT